MTFAEAEAVIAKTTYKPGWKISCFQLQENLAIFVIEVQYKSIDTRPGANGMIARLNNRRSRPLEFLTEDLLVMEIHRLLMETEIHELDEWLRYDGKLLRNPHA